ncbi:hypothetical protein NQZ68_022944 [Dissostichus eleginoides]|nr:hypothetical protein NQZ68_022944 [Dissostichus eleginoides]
MNHGTLEQGRISTSRGPWALSANGPTPNPPLLGVWLPAPSIFSAHVTMSEGGAVIRLYTAAA